MNVNIFFLFLAVLLLSIYMFFKPLYVQKNNFGTIPLFELKDFELYELNTSGLTTLMTGKSATKYKDKYIVQSINFTDNSQSKLMSVKADNGIYEEDNISLSGSIELFQEDGFTFKTEHAFYNRKNSILNIDTNYTARKKDDKFSGASLRYNNLLDKIESKNIYIIYQLEESI